METLLLSRQLSCLLFTVIQMLMQKWLVMVSWLEKLLVGCHLQNHWKPTVA